MVTSPLGLVPRDLEEVWPAGHYDIPVTGDWTQDEINRVEDDMIRGYVLKQDFIREIDVVHQKLDRILELMIKQNSK